MDPHEAPSLVGGDDEAVFQPDPLGIPVGKADKRLLPAGGIKEGQALVLKTGQMGADDGEIGSLGPLQGEGIGQADDFCILRDDHALFVQKKEQGHQGKEDNPAKG